MIQLLKKVPLYPFFFASFSVLSLYARNMIEVDAGVLLRPLLFSLTSGILVYGILRLVLRNWEKAAVVTAFLFLLFNSYGLVYQYFEQVPVLSGILGRHRYLLVIYTLLLAAGIYGLVFKLKSPQVLFAPLLVMGLFLVVFPLVQIGIFAVRSEISSQASSALAQEAQTLAPDDLEHLPDVYFIVLDSYTRSDALQTYYSYDNSSFTGGLRDQGFYVANCSRSNYGYTQGSLISALNLDYLDALYARMAEMDPPTTDINVLLKESLVRQQLEQLGYQTVAFETGYEWSRLSDADIFLSVTEDSLQVQQALKPFEAMYIKSTALLPVSDIFFRSQVNEFRNPNYPYCDHIECERFLLDQLPRLSKYSDQPIFVFAHVLIPHVPFVFDASGEIVTDPGFYSGEKAGPINDAYQAEGYINQVEFISSQMLAITKQILEQSSEPPVIVIMGDHGFLDENRYMILNAYYLPDQNYSELYPGITPVNSFRIIFNQYFGGDYDLLPDLSLEYEGNETMTVEETNPACLEP